MFFKEEGNTLFFLPCVPPDFHVGKMTHIQTSAGDEIDFEWSKKQVRRVILTVHSERKLQFRFQKHLARCRVRKSLKDRGKSCTLLEEQLKLDLPHPCKLILDRFEK